MTGAAGAHRRLLRALRGQGGGVPRALASHCRRARRGLSAALLGVASLLARAAGAEEPPSDGGSRPPEPAAAGAEHQSALNAPAALPARPAVVTIEKTIVQLSVSFRDVVDGEISRKLLSGLPTVITMRGYLFRESGGDPVALAAKSCRVVYDLWDEVFRIQLIQAGGQSSTVAVNVEGVLRNCAEARKMPLAERSLLRDGTRYFVAVLVEVNPVSAEMLDRIKRWVTRPPGSTAIGPGDSLFGSFVGLFVTRIGSADRKLAFRTQSFLPPSAPSR
jgi:hypothetical protein